jgi:hypothetical protein
MKVLREMHAVATAAFSGGHPRTRTISGGKARAKGSRWMIAPRSALNDLKQAHRRSLYVGTTHAKHVPMGTSFFSRRRLDVGNELDHAIHSRHGRRQLIF